MVTTMTSMGGLDMDRICRVCLQENSDLFLLFDESHSVDGVPVSKMLSECTIYKVDRYDELPHQICSVCLETARQAFRFKKLVEESYCKLLTLLGTVSNQERFPRPGYTEKCTQTDESIAEICDDEKGFKASDIFLNSTELNLEERSTLNTQCPLCGKHFSRKDHMKRHIRNIHSNLDPNLENGNQLSLEEPEIDLNEDNPATLSTKSIFSDLSFDRKSVPDDFAKDDSECDKFDDLNITNPISSDGDEDEKPLSLLSMGEKRTVKVEPNESVDQGSVDVSLMNVKYESESEHMEKDSENSSEDEDDDEIDETCPSKILRNRNKTTSRRRTYVKSKDNRCPDCQRVFSRHCHLRRHMLTHLSEKPHECEQCLKRFTRRDHLKNHIDSIHRAKDFKCDQCDCAFPRNESLKRHKETKHADGKHGNKVHKCDFCDKTFTTDNYLRKHRILHTDRIFACKHCDESFKDRAQYRDHEKTHNVERNFLCSICGDSFLRNDYLMVHMRRHTGEKPYKCQYCGKGFPRATDVKVHERYHTGHKPNLCTLCGKGFHRAYNLTIHMRTHTGERPFQCEHCPKSFAQSNDLKAHVRRHTGERFKCSTCDAGFLQRYGLRQHALAAHGIQIESITGRLQKFATPSDGQDEVTRTKSQEDLDKLKDLKSNKCNNDLCL